MQKIYDLVFRFFNSNLHDDPETGRGGDEPEQGPGGPQLQQLQAQPGHAPCQACARNNYQ